MIHVGDCVEVMRGMDAGSVDAVVCDPPYGLEFMGKEWDALGRRIGHPLDPEKSITKDTSREARDPADPWQKETSGYGAPRKNKRCRKCGRLAFTTNPCDCPAPDWDTRTAEYASEMQRWHETWAVEALRVLKPGGHIVAFGGTRTYHRLAAALEDAGFEIRDCLSWMYGQGFPKSLDVAKAIDVAAGVEREVVGRRTDRAATPIRDMRGGNFNATPDARVDASAITAPATPEAARWEGWGTALKPSWEPVVLARKPLAGTVAGNVLEHGTGALNIDATRIGAPPPSVPQPKFGSPTGQVYGFRAGEGRNGEMSVASGRWPANMLLSHDPDCVQLDPARVNGNGHHPAARGEGGLGTAGHAGQDSLDERSARGELAERWACVPGCAVRLLDDQTRSLARAWSAPSLDGTYESSSYHVPKHAGYQPSTYGDEGGASRFFYCAKASRAERNAGLDGEASRRLRTTGKGLGAAPRCPEHEEPLPGGSNTYRCGCPTAPRRQAELEVAQRNHHPTVKPVAVMRWLCRLVTPPGGLVLDPFTGSGTTGIAATLEGFRFVGIERDAEYAELARRRVAYWTLHGEEALDVVRRAERSERERVVVAESGQLDLFGGAG